ncbi:MAG: nuclear transport factor 2 family protein, partial [Phormidesmis sp. CAN_BIN44]|nr:nuclear transport factor 2 family protein [Phormidesmis sp. CAN_BIN44]
QQETIGQILEDGCTEIQVTGRVKTPWFSMSVSWLFTLNDQQEIVFSKLKLIASPQELLKLRK